MFLYAAIAAADKAMAKPHPMAPTNIPRLRYLTGYDLETMVRSSDLGLGIRDLSKKIKIEKFFNINKLNQPSDRTTECKVNTFPLFLRTQFQVAI